MTGQKFNVVCVGNNAVCLAKKIDYWRMTRTDLVRTLIARNVRNVNGQSVKDIHDKFTLAAACECSDIH